MEIKNGNVNVNKFSLFLCGFKPQIHPPRKCEVRHCLLSLLSGMNQNHLVGGIRHFRFAASYKKNAPRQGAVAVRKPIPIKSAN